MSKHSSTKAEREQVHMLSRVILLDMIADVRLRQKTLLKKSFLFMYMCVCFCVCAHVQMPLSQRASDLLEMELQAVISHLVVGTGN